MATVQRTTREILKNLFKYSDSLIVQIEQKSPTFVDLLNKFKGKFTLAGNTRSTRRKVRYPCTSPPHWRTNSAMPTGGFRVRDLTKKKFPKGSRLHIKRHMNIPTAA